MNETKLLLELTRRYTEAHRRYHDLLHVADMLCKGSALDLSDEQVMAVWFHDAIYQPGGKTNEQDSADLCVKRLSALGWNNNRVQVVRQIVLDTDEHVPSIDESKKVIDLDLSTLAATWAEYQENGRRIKSEYNNLSDADWDAGRAVWLKEMLGRGRLFWTDWGRPLEQKARDNLRRDLESLP